MATARIAVHMASANSSREDRNALTEFVNVIAFNERCRHLLMNCSKGQADRGDRRRDVGVLHEPPDRRAEDQPDHDRRGHVAAAASIQPKGTHTTTSRTGSARRREPPCRSRPTTPTAKHRASTEQNPARHGAPTETRRASREERRATLPTTKDVDRTGAEARSVPDDRGCAARAAPAKRSIRGAERHEERNTNPHARRQRRPRGRAARDQRRRRARGRERSGAALSRRERGRRSGIRRRRVGGRRVARRRLRGQVLEGVDDEVGALETRGHDDRVGRVANGTDDRPELLTAELGPGRAHRATRRA